MSNGRTPRKAEREPRKGLWIVIIVWALILVALLAALATQV